jgi:hypothetical protein
MDLIRLGDAPDVANCYCYLNRTPFQDMDTVKFILVVLIAALVMAVLGLVFARGKSGRHTA